MWTTTTELFPHQRPAIPKLMKPRVGALFMEMGLGKTRSAIELARIRYERGKIDKVVWFCPVSLKVTAKQELRKHTTLPPGQVYAFDEHTTLDSLPEAFWYIIGIESMSQSDRTALAANSLIDERTYVIVDESTYIKGHEALRTQRITYMAQRARYRLILTGTPLTNGVEDLFAQMYFLSPKILGYSSFYSFSANHLEYSDEHPGLVVRAHNTEYLAAKLQPYVYQVTKAEALSLPPKIYDSIYCELSWQQMELYDQAKFDLLLDLPDDEIDSTVIFRLFTALQQIVSGFWNQYGRTIEIPHYRLDTLLESLDRFPQGEKVIIWCKFRYSVRAIVKALAGRYGSDSVAQLYGDLTERERTAELERFQDGAQYLVATGATGGHGLNLAYAAYAVFYENSFKYADRLQAEDRIHRIGQQRRPTYLDVATASGIDQKIEQSLMKKGNLLDDFKRQVRRVRDKQEGAVEEIKQLVKAL